MMTPAHSPMKLAILAALACASPAIAQKVPPQQDNQAAKRTPREAQEEQLNALARRGIAAYERAEAAAKKCDRAGLAAAIAEIKAIHGESRAIAAAVKSAGKFAAVDYIPALNVSESMALMVSDAQALTLSNCPEQQSAQVTSHAPEPKQEPKGSTGEIGSQSRYRPAPASVAEQARYREEVETEFANVEDARARGDCPGWEQAIARLTALLNNFRANMTNAADPGNRVIWADKLARARANRPICSEIEAARAAIGPVGGAAKAEQAKPAGAKPAQAAPTDSAPPRDEKGASQARLPASEAEYGGTPNQPAACTARCTANPRAPGRICATDAKGEVNKCNLSEPPPK